MTRTAKSRLTAMRGGCEQCAAAWQGKNALPCAARHHDRTRHRTWAEQTIRTEYGDGRSARTASREGRLL